MTQRERKELKPEDITVWTDTREQKPLDLAPLNWERRKLDTGDYSIRGLEHIVSVERKSLNDLLGCIGKHRDRFEREIDRLLAYESRMIVVETSWRDLEAGAYQRSRIHPNAAVGAVMGWIARGIPICLVGNHQLAGKFVARFLFTVAKRRWNQLQGLDQSLRVVYGKTPDEIYAPIPPKVV